jgi:hypothetical protein
MTSKKRRSAIDQMKRRNNSVRAMLRRLVRRGMTRMDAARTVGVGYDCALMWTRDLPRDKATEKPPIEFIDDFKPVRPREPTPSLVGSQERVEAYRRRVEQGEDLYHPQDNQECHRE